MRKIYLDETGHEISIPEKPTGDHVKVGDWLSYMREHMNSELSVTILLPDGTAAPHDMLLGEVRRMQKQYDEQKNTKQL